jgi:hypothetical protein
LSDTLQRRLASIDVHTFTSLLYLHDVVYITGELYPAPQWAEAFAGAARALQLGGMVLMFAGDLLFNTLHLPQPFFYSWIAVCIDSTTTLALHH